MVKQEALLEARGPKPPKIDVEKTRRCLQRLDRWFEGNEDGDGETFTFEEIHELTAAVLPDLLKVLAGVNGFETQVLYRELKEDERWFDSEDPDDEEDEELQRRAQAEDSDDEEAIYVGLGDPSDWEMVARIGGEADTFSWPNATVITDELWSATDAAGDAYSANALEVGQLFKHAHRLLSVELDEPGWKATFDSSGMIVLRDFTGGDGEDWKWLVGDIDAEFYHVCEEGGHGPTFQAVGQLVKHVHRLLSAELDHLSKFGDGAWEVTFRSSKRG